MFPPCDQQFDFVHARRGFAVQAASGFFSAHLMVHMWSPHGHAIAQSCKAAQRASSRHAWISLEHLSSLQVHTFPHAALLQSGPAAIETIASGSDQQFALAHWRRGVASFAAAGFFNAHLIVHMWSPHAHPMAQVCNEAQFESAIHASISVEHFASLQVHTFPHAALLQSGPVAETA